MIMLGLAKARVAGALSGRAGAVEHWQQQQQQRRSGGVCLAVGAFLPVADIQRHAWCWGAGVLVQVQCWVQGRAGQRWRSAGCPLSPGGLMSARATGGLIRSAPLIPALQPPRPLLADADLRAR